MSSQIQTTNQALSSANDIYHLKVLVPIFAVGPLMGAGGSIMTQLEKITNTRIALSRNGDMYPGTRERVCRISGQPESVLQMMDVLADKIQALMYKAAETSVDFIRRQRLLRRSRQVKLLIPDASASKVIGRCGSQIERMRIASGSFIQVSQVSRDVELLERFVLIYGNLDCNKRACRMVFELIAPDTTANYYQNVNYSNARIPLPNSDLDGPPSIVRGPKNTHGSSVVHLGGTSTSNDVVHNTVIQSSDPAFSSESIVTDGDCPSEEAKPENNYTTANPLSQYDGIAATCPTGVSNIRSPDPAFTDTLEMDMNGQIPTGESSNSSFLAEDDLLKSYSELLDNLKMTLRNLSYEESVVTQATDAFNILIRQGVLEACFFVMKNFCRQHSKLRNVTSYEGNDTTQPHVLAAEDQLPSRCVIMPVDVIRQMIYYGSAGGSLDASTSDTIASTNDNVISYSYPTAWDVSAGPTRAVTCAQPAWPVPAPCVIPSSTASDQIVYGSVSFVPNVD